MEFPFPPEPPGYNNLQTARCLMGAWALLGGTIVVFRIRQWNFIRWYELFPWAISGWIIVFVLSSVKCELTGYIDNSWLLLAPLAAMGVSVTGMIVCLARIYVSLPNRFKMRVIGATALIGFPCVIWLLLPGLGHPRWIFELQRCRNNLKYIGLAISSFESRHGSIPPSITRGTGISWRVTVLPYLEQNHVFSMYNPDRHWNQPPNAAIAMERIESLICPSNYHWPKDELGRWYTAYSMPTGPHTIGADPKGTSIKDITDGTSQTALVMESCGAQIVWTEPRDINVSEMSPGVNLNGSRPGRSNGWMSSYHHVRSAHLLLADGSVRSISTNTDPDVLRKLVTIDGEAGK